MLFRFDPTAHTLSPLRPAAAWDAGLSEKQIEVALAHHPASIFKSGRDGPPLLVVKKSVPGQRMADIIALDSEGRLVLVECKRGWASRDALSQLLDYASDYDQDPHVRLQQDWSTGEGRGSAEALLDRFRAFADDREFEAEGLGREQVLVVVAAGKDDGFDKIAGYLQRRGVPVYFVPVAIFAGEDGQLFLEAEPINLAPSGRESESAGAPAAFMVNTDETHSHDAWKRFLERGVAGIWGYPERDAPLQQGARTGDIIYAYRNGVGVIARGVVVDGEVHQAERETSVFPECGDGNEWHLRVDWTPFPGPGPGVSNAFVRKAAGAGLPVRNTFCHLWNQKVQQVLDGFWGAG